MSCICRKGDAYVIQSLSSLNSTKKIVDDVTMTSLFISTSHQKLKKYSVRKLSNLVCKLANLVCKIK